MDVSALQVPMPVQASGVLPGTSGSEDLMALKKALITGITGQDGSYLAEFLLGRICDWPSFFRWPKMYLAESSPYLLKG